MYGLVWGACEIIGFFSVMCFVYGGLSSIFLVLTTGGDSCRFFIEGAMF